MSAEASAAAPLVRECHLVDRSSPFSRPAALSARRRRDHRSAVPRLPGKQGTRQRQLPDRSSERRFRKHVSARCASQTRKPRHRGRRRTRWRDAGAVGQRSASLAAGAGLPSRPRIPGRDPSPPEVARRKERRSGHRLAGRGLLTGYLRGARGRRASAPLRGGGDVGGMGWFEWMRSSGSTAVLMRRRRW
jgi:hypothetical protein